MLQVVSYNDYDAAEVLEGLLLLGDSVPDPDPIRRVDMVTSLRTMYRPYAVACLLYAQGYTGAEIGRRFKKTPRTGQRMLEKGLRTLRQEMNRCFD